MKRLLLATAILLSASPPALSALITINVFDNGALAGSSSSATGVAHFNSTSIAGFDSVSIDADGIPALTGGDLSSTTLDVTSSGAGTHTLTVDISQTGITVPHGTAHSTFTTNNLIGLPGPVTESTSGNNAQLASHIFPAGTMTDSFGPVNTPIGALTSDGQQYVATFNGADESFNGTIELTTTAIIPEASTWSMMALGFGLLAFFGVKRRRRTPLSIA